MPHLFDLLIGESCEKKDVGITYFDKHTKFCFIFLYQKLEMKLVKLFSHTDRHTYRHTHSHIDRRTNNP